MIVRALDENGDWLFGASLNNYLVNNTAVAQNIKTRISSFLGDCFFDLGAGINWFYYLSNTNTELPLNLSISAVIINTAFVTGILQLSVNLNRITRTFSVSYQVQTSFSVTGNSFQYTVGAVT